MTPPRDPSVFDEPHLTGDFAPDPSEMHVAGQPQEPVTSEGRADHNVWDEPGMDGGLAGVAPSGTGRFAELLEARQAETGFAKSWLVTLGVALAAGPWAVLGAFYGSGQTVFSFLAIVAIGPMVEEVMKVALALWVVERKPWLFRGRFQILAVGLLAGLSFASLENLVYLYIYIPDPSPEIVAWRLTVCTALHVGCSVIAAMGLMKAWQGAVTERRRADLTIAFPYIITAVVIHGVYNFIAILIDPVFRA